MIRGIILGAFILGALTQFIIIFFIAKKKCANCIFAESYKEEMEGVLEAIGSSERIDY